MSGRPEPLWPLFGGLETLDGIGPKTAQALVAAHIEKPRDLLFTLPHSGVDRSRRASILEVQAPAVCTVEVTVGQHNAPSARGRPYRVMVEDAQTTFQLIFFRGHGDYCGVNCRPDSDGSSLERLSSLMGLGRWCTRITSSRRMRPR